MTMLQREGTADNQCLKSDQQPPLRDFVAQMAAQMASCDANKDAQIASAHPAPCPYCGYCPTCGRPRWPQQWPFRPWDNPYRPYWTTDPNQAYKGGTTDSNTRPYAPQIL